MADHFLDELVGMGFKVTIRRLGEESVEVRIEAPSGTVSSGYGRTIATATISAFMRMVTRLEEYLADTESRRERAENTLHRNGILLNALDENEVRRAKDLHAA